MPILHHLENSRSTRIIWLLEELNVDYELVTYHRQSNRLAPASLKKIHPLGKAPIFTHNDKTIAESGAIIEYVLHVFDKQHVFKPTAGDDAWISYQFWMHFAEGSAMPPLLMSLIFSEIPKRAPIFIRPIANAISKQVMSSFVQPNIDNTLDLIEQTLTKHAWFAGTNISGADVQMSFVIEAFNARQGLASHPNTKQWLENVRLRPAYQTALKKGGNLILG